MSKAVPIRDVSPMLKAVRNFLLGREHTLAVRFEKDLVTRSPPPPNLPEGPAALLSANYYCNRDPRREVEKPLEIKTGQLIGEGEQLKLPRPGMPHNWD